METVDCIVDPGLLQWVKIPDGMELRICTIPAGATLLSMKFEADGRFHIRYIEGGNPCTVNISVGESV